MSEDRGAAGPAGKTMAVVTTPHALHSEHVAFALQRNWHVLCDKPFVMRSSEAGALAREAAGHGSYAVAFNRRLDRGCLRAREAIRSWRYWQSELRRDGTTRL